MIDFDRLAHEAQKPGTPVWRNIVDTFGTCVLDTKGRIDRAKLGSLVFSDSFSLQRLNEIVHPVLFDEWEKRRNEIARKDPGAVVVSDVPLLVEGKLQHLFDITILVWASPERQIERIMKRNNLTRREAQARLDAQMKIDDKKGLVDYVIDNDGDIERTKSQFDNLWRIVMTLKEAKEPSSPP